MIQSSRKGKRQSLNGFHKSVLKRNKSRQQHNRLSHSLNLDRTDDAVSHSYLQYLPSFSIIPISLSIAIVLLIWSIMNNGKFSSHKRIDVIRAGIRQCEQTNNSISNNCPVFFSEMILTIIVCLSYTGIRWILLTFIDYHWIIDHIPSGLLGNRIKKRFSLTTNISNHRLSKISKRLFHKFVSASYIRIRLQHILPSNTYLYTQFIPLYITLRFIVRYLNMK
jgi:hypothetical protein